MNDTQRAKLFVAEEQVWPQDQQISNDEVTALVDELNSIHEREIHPVFIDGTGHAKLHGREMILPPWSRRPLVILHEYAHALVHPVFPCHGAEYAACLLGLVRAHVDPRVEEELRRRFDALHVHYDVGVRKVRARRGIVNAINAHPGALMEIIADNPPELILGAVGERAGNAVFIGDNLVEFERLRYVNYLPAAEPR